MKVLAEVVVYKILRRAEWEELTREGVFAGSADDARDGFIHLSAAPQLAGTLARHFCQPEDREVVLVAVPIEGLGDTLRWEPSRDGQLFPHLYAGLRLADVAWRETIARGSSGHYVLPDRIRS